MSKSWQMFLFSSNAHPELPYPSPIGKEISRISHMPNSMITATKSLMVLVAISTSPESIKAAEPNHMDPLYAA